MESQKYLPPVCPIERLHPAHQGLLLRFFVGSRHNGLCLLCP